MTQRHEIETIPIQGMDCSDCTLSIEHSLSRIDGVKTASVNYAAATLSIEYDKTKVSRSTIVNRINSLGYRVPKTGIIAFVEEKRELLFALSSGLLLGVGYALSYYVPQASIFFYLAAYFFGGWDIGRHAWHALREKRFDTDLLMVAAALGAAAIGQFAEGALLLFLFSLGHALEELALDRARNAVNKLGQLTPKTALIRRNGREEVVSVETLVLDDIVIVRPGARIPADGQIAAGSSSVDQASITGESVPVDKVEGDKVFAGTVNGEGALEIKVTRLAKDNTLSRVMKMVEEAQGQKTNTQKLTEKFTKYFVPAVLLGDLLFLVAQLAFAVPFDLAFLRAMTVLVAASPCALALGAPSAMLAAIARAASNGVLVKGGVHLETLGAIEIVAFDKTGTLTHGRPEVVEVLASGDRVTEDQLLAAAAAVESRSGHPLAAAIVRAAQARSLSLPAAGDLTSITGKGLRSTVDEKPILIGNARLMEESSIDVPAAFRLKVTQLEESGKTTVLVALEDQLIGAIALADTPRENAKDSIAALKKLGVKQTLLLTGDNAKVGKSIADSLGIDAVRAELMPEDKVNALRELAAGRSVAMVGDGVNDAPALAAASVGVAMGGASTDVALETADVALMSDDLSKLPFAVSLGRATRRIVLQNLLISGGVIALLLGASLIGAASIGIAVIVHEGSTLVVVANSLRLLRHKLSS